MIMEDYRKLKKCLYCRELMKKKKEGWTRYLNKKKYCSRECYNKARGVANNSIPIPESR